MQRVLFESAAGQLAAGICLQSGQGCAGIALGLDSRAHLSQKRFIRVDPNLRDRSIGIHMVEVGGIVGRQLVAPQRFDAASVFEVPADVVGQCHGVPEDVIGVAQPGILVGLFAAQVGKGVPQQRSENLDAGQALAPIPRLVFLRAEFSHANISLGHFLKGHQVVGQHMQLFPFRT